MQALQAKHPRIEGPKETRRPGGPLSRATHSGAAASRFRRKRSVDLMTRNSTLFSFCLQMFDFVLFRR